MRKFRKKIVNLNFFERIFSVDFLRVALACRVSGLHFHGGTLFLTLMSLALSGDGSAKSVVVNGRIFSPGEPAKCFSSS